MRNKRSVSLTPEGDQRIKKIADEEFHGNYSMALEFLAKLGEEKRKADGWGGKDADGLRELVKSKGKAKAKARA